MSFKTELKSIPVVEKCLYKSLFILYSICRNPVYLNMELQVGLYRALYKYCTD
jgi:hypothetical protein